MKWEQSSSPYTAHRSLRRPPANSPEASYEWYSRIARFFNWGSEEWTHNVTEVQTTGASGILPTLATIQGQIADQASVGISS